MRIRLKTLDLRDHDLEVSPDIPLSEFRQIIVSKLNVPLNRQRLIFQGRPLLDESKLLSAYGLGDGMAVHLVERPPEAYRRGRVNNGEPNTTGRFGSRNRIADMPQRPGHVEGQNETPLIATNIPFERTALFADQQALENLTRRALAQIPYLSAEDRSAITVEWRGLDLVIRIPANRNPEIASPAMERLNIVYGNVLNMRHFREIIERPGGLADRVDRIIDARAGDIFTSEDLAALTQQARDIARELEAPLPVPVFPHVQRGALPEEHCDSAESEADREARQTEWEARRQVIAHIPTAETRRTAHPVPPERQPETVVLRHVLDSDLASVVREYREELARLAVHIERYENLLHSRILFNFDNERLNDGRADILAVYLEHMQRNLHRSSHAQHLISDLNVHLCDPIPRRLYPQYQNMRAEVPTEGEIILRLYPSEREGEASRAAELPAEHLLHVPSPATDVAALSPGERPISYVFPSGMIRRQQRPQPVHMSLSMAIPVVAGFSTAPGQPGASNNPFVIPPGMEGTARIIYEALDGIGGPSPDGQQQMMITASTDPPAASGQPIRGQLVSQIQRVENPLARPNQNPPVPFAPLQARPPRTDHQTLASRLALRMRDMTSHAVIEDEELSDLADRLHNLITTTLSRDEIIMAQGVQPDEAPNVYESLFRSFAEVALDQMASSDRYVESLSDYGSPDSSDIHLREARRRRCLDMALQNPSLLLEPLRHMSMATMMAYLEHPESYQRLGDDRQTAAAPRQGTTAPGPIARPGPAMRESTPEGHLEPVMEVDEPETIDLHPNALMNTVRPQPQDAVTTQMNQANRGNSSLFDRENGVELASAVIRAGPRLEELVNNAVNRRVFGEIDIATMISDRTHQTIREATQNMDTDAARRQLPATVASRLSDMAQNVLGTVGNSRSTPATAGAAATGAANAAAATTPGVGTTSIAAAHLPLTEQLQLMQRRQEAQLRQLRERLQQRANAPPAASQAELGLATLGTLPAIPSAPWTRSNLTMPTTLNSIMPAVARERTITVAPQNTAANAMPALNSRMPALPRGTTLMSSIFGPGMSALNSRLPPQPGRTGSSGSQSQNTQPTVLDSLERMQSDIAQRARAVATVNNASSSARTREFVPAVRFAQAQRVRNPRDPRNFRPAMRLSAGPQRVMPGPSSSGSAENRQPTLLMDPFMHCDSRFFHPNRRTADGRISHYSQLMADTGDEEPTASGNRSDTPGGTQRQPDPAEPPRSPRSPCGGPLCGRHCFCRRRVPVDEYHNLMIPQDETGLVVLQEDQEDRFIHLIRLAVRSVQSLMFENDMDANTQAYFTRHMNGILSRNGLSGPSDEGMGLHSMTVMEITDEHLAIENGGNENEEDDQAEANEQDESDQAEANEQDESDQDDTDEGDMQRHIEELLARARDRRPERPRMDREERRQLRNASHEAIRALASETQRVFAAERIHRLTNTLPPQLEPRSALPLEPHPQDLLNARPMGTRRLGARFTTRTIPVSETQANAIREGTEHEEYHPILAMSMGDSLNRLQRLLSLVLESNRHQPLEVDMTEPSLLGLIDQLAPRWLTYEDLPRILVRNFSYLSSSALRERLRQFFLSQNELSSGATDAGIEAVAKRLAISKQLIFRLFQIPTHFMLRRNRIDTAETIREIEIHVFSGLITVLFNDNLTGAEWVRNSVDLGFCYVRLMMGLARLATGGDMLLWSCISRTMSLSFFEGGTTLVHRHFFNHILREILGIMLQETYEQYGVATEAELADYFIMNDPTSSTPAAERNNTGGNPMDTGSASSSAEQHFSGTAPKKMRKDSQSNQEDDRTAPRVEPRVLPRQLDWIRTMPNEWQNTIEADMERQRRPVGAIRGAASRMYQLGWPEAKRKSEPCLVNEEDDLD